MNTTTHDDLLIVEPKPARGLRRLLSALAAAARERYDIRVMRRDLMSLDEHVLRDIGLRRDDLYGNMKVLAQDREACISGVRPGAQRHRRGIQW